jgi:hypothetical protein
MAIDSDTVVTDQSKGWPKRFTVVLFFFVCTLILYIDRVNISVVGPVLMEELGWDPAVMCSLSSRGAGLPIALAAKGFSVLPCFGGHSQPS